jgi:hypothetical protein
MIIQSQNNPKRMNFQLEQYKSQYLHQVIKPEFVKIVANNKNLNF